MVTQPIWPQIDVTIKSVADIFRGGRYEGDQHRKSRLSRLAMNKIGGETRGDGRLPCKPLVLLLGFVGQRRIGPRTAIGGVEHRIESDHRVEKSVPSNPGVVHPSEFLHITRRTQIKSFVVL